MDYSNRILETRKTAKMSQTDVANRLGKTQPTISGWENGEYQPDLKDILGMCNLFDVSPNQLLGYGDDADTSMAVEPEIRGPYIAYSDGEKEPLSADEELHLMQCLIRVRRGKSNAAELDRHSDTREKKMGST